MENITDNLPEDLDSMRQSIETVVAATSVPRNVSQNAQVCCPYFSASGISENLYKIENLVNVLSVLPTHLNASIKVKSFNNNLGFGIKF